MNRVEKGLNREVPPKKVWILMIVIILGVFGIIQSCGPKPVEVAISQKLELSEQWTDFDLSGVRVVGNYSEIIMSLPEQSYESASSNGYPEMVEARLKGKDGHFIDLDQKSVSSYNGRVYLNLSADELRWNQMAREFDKLFVRSAKPMVVGKVTWQSYEPSLTKDGLFPGDSY